MPALEVQIVSDTTQRSPAAERMRLHRERKKNGMRCLMIELRETEINALIAKKLLKGEMRNDIGAIIDALYLFLEQELDRSQ
jgi:hypothetical protein